MIEVVVRLRFTTPSLGDCRCKHSSTMHKNPSTGDVLFLPTWWTAVMQFAARVLNRYQSAVGGIAWNPVVRGVTHAYRRYYQAGRFTDHEAFLAGDEICVSAVLPEGVPVEGFQELLSIAGQYRGISPFKGNGQFGRFEVIAIERYRRTADEADTEIEKAR